MSLLSVCFGFHFHIRRQTTRKIPRVLNLGLPVSELTSTFLSVHDNWAVEKRCATFQFGLIEIDYNPRCSLLSVEVGVHSLLLYIFSCHFISELSNTYFKFLYALSNPALSSNSTLKNCFLPLSSSRNGDLLI